MRRLLLAELNRARSRRITWAALVVVVLALGGLQLAVYQSVKPLTTAQLAEGRSQFEEAQRAYEQNKEQYQAEEKQCIESGEPPEACAIEAPRMEDYSYQNATFAEMGDVAVTVSVYLTALAFLMLAASWIGAEYTTGALGNWLSFFPQRGRVLTAKLGAVVLVAGVVSAAAIAATVGVAALLTRLVGAEVSGIGPIAEKGGRGVVIVIIFAIIGFALALLTRHTIAAVGAVLAYLFASFVLLIITELIPSLQSIRPFLPQNNVSAFLNRGHTYVDSIRQITADGVTDRQVERTISFGDSIGYWSVVLALLIAGSYLVFRRRDVN